MNAIFAERQKNHLVVSLLESLEIAIANAPGMNVTELLLHVFTKVKVEGQPSLFEEEWEGVIIVCIWRILHLRP